ncbi:unnamed protein product [Alternaria alternata]
MGGSQPWPQVPVGNKDHTDAAVVIIGAGISEYPGQEEILDYLRNVARKYNLYKYIRFNTSVESAIWDDSKNRWKVDVNVTGGKDAEFNPAYSIECDFLVSAVGQLNQPQYPEIEGLGDFKGKIMHSARWDWSHSLEGKSVGIIGNGATAAQIIPEILPQTSSLTIYQRTPNWVIPRLDGPVSAFKRAVLRYLPPVRWRIRANMMDFRESFYDAVTDSSSEFAEVIRSSCIEMMKTQIPNQPDLWSKLTPDYSPGCKRVIISDDYYPAVANPKTILESNKIRRITETGIELEDGTHHEHDTIVLATGFRTVEFLHPIKVTGTQSRPLAEIWSSGATALYGTTIPSLPNFGLFYGPNTNLGHNSIILMIEAQSRYLNTLVSAVLDARNRGQRMGIMPKEDRTHEWNEGIQQILKNSSFADPKCNSWYKNKEGRITNNWSGTVIEYQEMLAKVDWEDFETTAGGGSAAHSDDGVMVEKSTGGVSASKVVFGTGKQETKIGRVHEETLVSNTTLVLGTLSAVAAGAAWVYRGKLPKRLGLRA